VSKWGRARSGRKVADPVQADNRKVVHFGGGPGRPPRRGSGTVTGGGPGRGRGEVHEKVRDASAKTATTTTSPTTRRRRRSERQRRQRSRRPFVTTFTRRARCPEVALGFRFGRLLILSISPLVRNASCYEVAVVVIVAVVIVGIVARSSSRSRS